MCMSVEESVAIVIFMFVICPTNVDFSNTKDKMVVPKLVWDC